MTDPRKIKRLIDWLVKQRAQHLDMVTDAGDASLWCKEEADLIREHIRTVEALTTRPKAHELQAANERIAALEAERDRAFKAGVEVAAIMDRNSMGDD